VIHQILQALLLKTRNTVAVGGSEGSHQETLELLRRIVQTKEFFLVPEKFGASPQF
jgi:hypothetical protein